VRYARSIIGYHGCTAAAATRLLRGASFAESQNDYDWLGRGVYFWEHGPDRAFRFIKEKLRRERRKERPAVIGAVLQLGQCFDLLDTRFTSDLRQAFPRFEASIMAAGVTLPRNAGPAPELKLRRLDCAMLNWYLSELEAEGQTYQTVRGCFVEGGPAFPGSGIERESHIQIAVRDPACLIGVFRPIIQAS
jgi:hypothetical protein